MTLERILSGVLTVAAVVVAAAAAHREFGRSSAQDASTRSKPPSFVREWKQVQAAAEPLSNGDSAITIVEFIDFECPFCRDFHRLTSALSTKYGNRLTVKAVHFPLALHRFAKPAARAAECARMQRRFPEYVSAIYAHQDSLGLKTWLSFAMDAGVPDTVTFAHCVASTADVPAIAHGLDIGKTIGVFGTPTVLINGWRYSQPPDEAELVRVVDALLAGGDPFAARSAQ